MKEEHVVAPDFKSELAHSFKEGEALNIAGGTT